MTSNTESENFAWACGQTAPIRLQILDARLGITRSVELPGPVAVVGSGEDCDLCLPHADVSRRHAYLQVIDARLACFDLDSRSGLHWGKKSKPRGFLAPGEPLHIGPYQVTLMGPVGNEQQIPLSHSKFSLWDAPGEQTVPFVLTFLNAHSRSGTKRVVRIVRRVTLVGWSDLCNMRLQHSSVDRVHCALVVAQGQLWLVDLKSENVASVNDAPVRIHPLVLGDQLRLGKFLLAVRSADSVGEDDESSLAADSEGMDSPAGEESRAIAPRGADPRRRPGGLVPRGGLRPIGPGEGLTVPSPASEGAEINSAALMSHFQTMQAQMLEHQQQMMAMVVQAFSSAHTRQLDVIREELQRVNDLNRELQELQARREGSELVGPGGAPPRAPAAGPAAGGFPPVGFPPGAFPPGAFPPGVFPPGMFPGMLMPGFDPLAPPPPAPRMPLPKASPRAPRPSRPTGPLDPASPELGGSSGSVPNFPGPGTGQPSALGSSPEPFPTQQPFSQLPPSSPTAAQFPFGPPPQTGTQPLGSQPFPAAQPSGSPLPANPGTAAGFDPITGLPTEPTPEEAGAYLGVSDRIKQLETERTSRWARILQLLNPSPGG